LPINTSSAAAVVPFGDVTFALSSAGERSETVETTIPSAARAGQSCFVQIRDCSSASSSTRFRASTRVCCGVLPSGERLRVRRTANLHTGGTIEDITDRLHPAIAEAAVRASRAIGIPVTGLDFLVPAVDGPDHVFIEANERPGLANHEPQPVAARFVDLLFPETRSR